MKEKPNLFKIHKDGYLFVAIFAIITFILGITWQPLGYIGFVMTLWCIYFFRDPDRIIPLEEHNILSPADGVVSKIEKVKMPPELEIGGDEVVRISIFLNVFNVHVNRVPASGKITKIFYYPGKFFNASLDKASIYNERNSVVMTLKSGQSLVFTQIAGLIARRILCELEVAQEVDSGQRYGLIRFGSRMDVYLPKGEVAQVAEGQQMVAGETIIARLGYKEPMQSVIK